MDQKKETAVLPKSSRGILPAIIQVAVAAAVLAVLTVFFSSSPLIREPAWLFLLILFVSGAAVLGFSAFLIRTRCRSDHATRALSRLSLFRHQTDIIGSLVAALEEIGAVHPDGSLREKTVRMRERLNLLQNAVSDLEQRPHSAQTEQSVRAARDEMAVLVPECAREFVRLSESRDAKGSELASLAYHLSVSIPILTDFTDVFREFSRDMILEVVNKFSDITASSHRIADDIERSMAALMDEHKQDSLAFIIRKARDLAIDFESFYKNMDNLRTVSDAFTEKSSEKLRTIQDMANSIEQIAETIKVLSLNVSIEAANTGAGGRGFQVLARDLREFTARTMRFAHDVKSRVQDALTTTEGLKSNYQQSMGVVYKYMEDIKGSILSFEGIIRSTFEQIKLIIENIRRFARHIDTGIQEAVGKLQYYDITSQEIGHLRPLLEKLFLERYNTRSLPADVERMIPETDRAEIRRGVLGVVAGVITTPNERKILKKYEETFGMKAGTESKTDAGSPGAPEKTIFEF